MKKKENRNLGSNQISNLDPSPSYPNLSPLDYTTTPTRQKFTLTCQLSFLTVTSLTGDPTLRAEALLSSRLI